MLRLLASGGGPGYMSTAGVHKSERKERSRKSASSLLGPTDGSSPYDVSKIQTVILN